MVDRATQVFRAVVSGTLKLRIERTYSLSDAAQVHRDLESRKTRRKATAAPMSLPGDGSGLWVSKQIVETTVERSSFVAVKLRNARAHASVCSCQLFRATLK